MRRAWRILDATHVHIVPLDAIFTHFTAAGEKPLKHSPCLSVWPANSCTRKTLSEKRFELNGSAQRYHVMSMYLCEREFVRRENEF